MLVESKSKNLVRYGPLSSTRVEILVLSADFAPNGQDDWTETEFNQSIVREREGKRPLLVGDLSFSLVDGIGIIDNVIFTDNSSWVRSRKFRLGVRAVPSSSSVTGIREAVSEAFVVLDHRGECKCFSTCLRLFSVNRGICHGFLTFWCLESKNSYHSVVVLAY